MLQGVLNVRLVAALSLFGLFLLVGCSSGERPEASPQMWATQPVMCSIGSGRVVLFTEDFDVVEGGTIRHGNERYCDYPLGGDMQVLWRYSPDWPFATYTVDGIEVQRLPDRATFTCPRVPGGLTIGNGISDVYFLADGTLVASLSAQKKVYAIDGRCESKKWRVYRGQVEVIPFKGGGSPWVSLPIADNGWLERPVVVEGRGRFLAATQAFRAVAPDGTGLLRSGGQVAASDMRQGCAIVEARIWVCAEGDRLVERLVEDDGNLSDVQRVVAIAPEGEGLSFPIVDFEQGRIVFFYDDGGLGYAPLGGVEGEPVRFVDSVPDRFVDAGWEKRDPARLRWVKYGLSSPRLLPSETRP
ncbi:MAG: hypothetical protein KDC39_09830 [Actinobacteria bacterium]|nr:hypothetical protein [Actinomycetota bacterium]